MAWQRLRFPWIFRGVRVEIFSCVLRLSRIDSVVVWRGSSCETIVSSAFHWPGIQRYRLNQLWNCAWPCSLVAVGNFFPGRGDLKSQGFCLLVRWFYFIRTMYTFILQQVNSRRLFVQPTWFIEPTLVTSFPARRPYLCMLHMGRPLEAYIRNCLGSTVCKSAKQNRQHKVTIVPWVYGRSDRWHFPWIFRALQNVTIYESILNNEWPWNCQDNLK